MDLFFVYQLQTIKHKTKLLFFPLTQYIVPVHCSQSLGCSDCPLSIGLQFIACRKITECTSQVVGFSKAVQIFKTISEAQKHNTSLQAAAGCILSHADQYHQDGTNNPVPFTTTLKHKFHSEQPTYIFIDLPLK